MRTLIPVCFAMAVALGLASPVVAQDAAPVTPEQFEQVVNVDGSIESLAKLVQNQQYDQIDVNRYYILEGSVASTQIFDPNPDTFQAVIELISSHWIGLERIEAFHLYVLVQGPEFATRVPERMPRDPGPEIIQANQKLLVMGPFIGTYPLTDTLEIPVVQGVVIR